MATVTSAGDQSVDEFVTKLKSRMESLGLTPKALAEKADVGYPYLYRVLKGQQTPSIDWAARVGSHVGLTIRTVLAGKSRPKKS